MNQKTPNQPQLEAGPTPTFEELAKSQGVKPISNIAELMGTPSPEDESLEEFAAMLRRWRSEGPSSPSQQ